MLLVWPPGSTLRAIRSFALQTSLHPASKCSVFQVHRLGLEGDGGVPDDFRFLELRKERGFLSGLLGKDVERVLLLQVDDRGAWFQLAHA